MAMSETFYVAAEENEIPEQCEWSRDLHTVKGHAADGAEDYNAEYLVYKVTIQPLYRTVRKVELEEV